LPDTLCPGGHAILDRGSLGDTRERGFILSLRLGLWFGFRFQLAFSNKLFAARRDA
jgi:hypothetical protein